MASGKTHTNIIMFAALPGTLSARRPTMPAPTSPNDTLLEFIGCACAKLHLVSDSGLRRVGCDETHELISRSRWPVWAVGVRHRDSARDGKARQTVGERRRWCSLGKQVRRRDVRSDGDARRLAELRSPRRSSAVGWGGHPGSLCRAKDGCESGDSSRRTRTGRGADGAR